MRGDERRGELGTNPRHGWYSWGLQGVVDRRVLENNSLGYLEALLHGEF